MAHLLPKHCFYVTTLCVCRTVTGTYHRCSLWALHLETVSAVNGSQRSPGCQRNHLCRGEAGRGNRCVQSPSSLYSRCHECCALGSRYPPFPTWKYSRYLFIKKPLTYPWDPLHSRQQRTFPNTKISSPKKGFPCFLPLLPFKTKVQACNTPQFYADWEETPLNRLVWWTEKKWQYAS